MQRDTKRRPPPPLGVLSFHDDNTVTRPTEGLAVRRRMRWLSPIWHGPKVDRRVYMYETWVLRETSVGVATIWRFHSVSRLFPWGIS